MEDTICTLISEIEDIIRDLDYGDITRNKLTDRLDGVVVELTQLKLDLTSDDL